MKPIKASYKDGFVCDMRELRRIANEYGTLDRKVLFLLLLSRFMMPRISVRFEAHPDMYFIRAAKSRENEKTIFETYCNILEGNMKKKTFASIEGIEMAESERKLYFPHPKYPKPRLTTIVQENGDGRYCASFPNEEAIIQYLSKF